MICASIGLRMASDASELLRSMPAEVDLAEIRLDLLDDPTPEPFCQAAPGRLIATCRRKTEGGGFAGSEAERLTLLDRARRAGARFVDIELDVPDSFTDSARGILRSHHDFSGTPARMDDLVERLFSHRGEAYKLAVTANSFSDALRVRDCLRGGHGDRKLACMAMGRGGLLTRVLGESWGSYITYAAAESGAATAPGQPSWHDLIHLYRAARLGRRPRVYGLVGTAIAHSLSPSLHNGWYERSGERSVYMPFDTDDLDDFVEFARRLPMSGWSVTAPFKERMAALVDTASPSAKLAGCVNTVILRRDGRLSGYNTDVLALLRLIGRRRGRRALVLGSGGTAVSAARALARSGIHVAIAARRHDKARRVCDEIGVELVSWNARGRARADILVNATSVGHGGSPGMPVARESLRAGLIVVDFPYGAADTSLARAARQSGCVVIDGRRLVLEQAKLQRRIFARHA